MRRLVVGILFVSWAATLVGCETMKGVGRDIQDGGQSIEKAAD